MRQEKTHTYVDCQRCGHWTDDHRHEDVCDACNNTQKAIDPREVLCNLCAGPMSPLGTPNEQYPHGLFEAKVMGGYNSYHLLDMSQYTFSFCEECLRKLFMQCKIKPDVDDVDFDGHTRQESWDKDQECYEYRVWKDSGGHHRAYLDRKCNAIKDCPNKAAHTVFISEEFTEEALCEEHKDHYKNTTNARLSRFIPHELKPFL